MDAFIQRTHDGSSAGYRPPNTSRWTKDRDLFREACVERSRAGFLAMRLLTLREESDVDGVVRFTDASEDTRSELQVVVTRYATLLIRLGELPSAVVSLVNELATTVATHAAWSSSRHLDDLRGDLLQWALDACEPVYADLPAQRRASSMQRKTDTFTPDGSARTENIRATP
jgi:hypothetical protein